jgi:hypothetical protein
MPPFIVLAPWALSLLLEFLLIALLLRRQLYREVPVFAAVVILYALLDAAAMAARFSGLYLYAMLSLREIGGTVLRTWLLVELCRRLLSDHRWTKRLLLVALLGSALLLVSVGFPVFQEDQSPSLFVSAFMQLGVWLRTMYFTQVGVIAILFLINFNTNFSGFSREIGMALGVATASSASLVSLTLRGHSGSGDYAALGLNYLGMVTAVAIWIMFLNPREGSSVSDEEVRDGNDEQSAHGPISQIAK